MSYSLRGAIPDQAKEDLASFHPVLQNLLYHRGLTTRESAEKFLHPDFELDLHDPFLMKGMREAAERIVTGIRNGENILIYSDYDADGIPGGVVLRDFFEKIGHTKINNYIPDRHEEGYGFHKEALQDFKDAGVTLIITVDCGIVDNETVAQAHALGIDVIITDHHEPGDVLPQAFAVVNHKQKGCEYPEQILCGSGVVFKLIQAILSIDRFGMKVGQEKWFLDLVGMATLSDMVPLVGENRALAHYGLKVLQKSPRLGLQALWKKLGVDPRLVTEDDIGFSLSPRINAASRMGSPRKAFELLKTRDAHEAEMLSEHLNSLNDERKGVVASIVKDIKKHIREREATNALSSVLVIGNPAWKPSLLGLVGNSLLDEYKKPLFIWGRNGDGIIKGSWRVPEGFDGLAIVEAAKDHFIHYGGHTMAGGFAVEHDKIHTLEAVLATAFDALPKSEIVTEHIDAQISVDDITWDLYRHIERLAPFGVGNPKPMFLIANALITEVKQFGKEKNHFELTMNRSGKPLKAITFFAKPEDFTALPQAGLTMNIVATLEKSNFRNFPELRVRIIDIIT